MATENVEQKQVSEESKPTETGGELVRRGLGELISKESGAVPKETEGEKPSTDEEITPSPELITFKNKVELEKHIQTQVKAESNRIANKSTASLQSANDELRQQLKSLQSKLEDKQEDSKLSKLEKAELEESGDTPEVRDTQEVRREIVKLGRVNRDKAKELEGTASKLQEVERQQDAFAKALKFFLPEDNEEFLSNVDTFAKKLASAETQKERDLIIELEEAKRHVEVEPKVSKPKPDSSLPTASGGMDASKLHGGEAVRYALTHPKK